MAMDELLKEAIADAKAVRETALANAKAALEEAFAPKLQSMLNATLQNETELEEEELDEFGNPVIKEPSEEEIEAEVVPEPVATDVTSGQLTGQDEDELEEESTEDIFSLESIVKELEEEAAQAESSDEPIGEEMEKEEGEDEIDEVNSSTSFGTADNKKPAAGASSAKTDDPQGSIKPNHPKAKEGGAHEIHESEEEVNLEELINELKAEYSEVETPSLEAELEEAKKNLDEHRKVITFLRGKLNEVNLLNAKLLFTNKLFKNHSMNESQKLRVIETLDRATTLKECKLVYSTLEEAYSGIKSDTKAPSAKRVVESIASKPINSTKPSEETVKTVINEGTDLAERFKKLAGIIK